MKKTLTTFALIFLLPFLLLANGREKTNFNSTWKFKSSITTDGPAAESYNDSSWETIHIPHSWNATDGQDGGGNYLKTASWYRKTLSWDAAYAGKKIYLEFLGANTLTECFVNGTSVGTHQGGYTAFRFDITNNLKEGDNVIAIKVDNRINNLIIPLSGDFTFYGGIYRDVNIIVADPVHVDLMDNGASGLYLTTTDVSETSAKLEVKAKIINESSTGSKNLAVKVTFRHPDTFEGIDEITKTVFDVATMSPGGNALYEQTISIGTLAAGASYELKETISVNNPRLWNGLKDPYRYLVELTVLDAGNGNAVLDKLSDYVGFRYFSADKTGFYLNGELYPLRGICIHQDFEGMGNAVTKNEHNMSFALMYEIGANTARLAHYPHDPYMYELCDKYGIVVWAEIPYVDKPGTPLNDFYEVTKNQFVEMIRQQYNRPSILMWGLQNEVSTGSYNTEMSYFMPVLHNLAKEEDPSRLTVQAQAGTARYNWTTDLYAFNRYPGWYQTGSVASYMDGFKSLTQLVGLSEYGAGANIDQHEINPEWPTHNGPWHPEEYQNKVHEEAIVDIAARPHIWGTFVWNMFDFGSDSRNEGGKPGVNDKGLVTFDRKIKKDSFYAYKVNWSSEPELYISSRRYTERNHDFTPVVIYSNCDEVELFVNGVSQGKKSLSAVSCGIFKWTNIQLTNRGEGETGKNTIYVTGTKDGKTYEDEAIWYRRLGTTTTISSTRLVVDNIGKTISLTVQVDASKITQFITADNNATFAVYASDGTTPVTSGNVEADMKLKVVSEDESQTVFYTFVSAQHLALNKTITASASESANPAKNAVDGNVSTRWAGTSTGQHTLEVDLGKEYYLNQIRIQWYQPTSSRYYTYKVSAGKTKSTYLEVIDRSSNTQGGTVTDDLNTSDREKTKGRYVKLQVLSSTTSGYPSLYELEVYGWLLESELYGIDYTTNTITVPIGSENILVETFLNNISFLGNYGAEPKMESAAYYIMNGDKLIITDSTGKEYEFVLEMVPVSIDSPEADNLFTITNEDGEVLIVLNQNNEAKLEIIDTAGKIIESKKIKDSHTTHLSDGIYFFRLSGAEFETQTIKYIVK